MTAYGLEAEYLKARGRRAYSIPLSFWQEVEFSREVQDEI